MTKLCEDNMGFFILPIVEQKKIDKEIAGRNKRVIYVYLLFPPF